MSLLRPRAAPGSALQRAPSPQSVSKPPHNAAVALHPASGRRVVCRASSRGGGDTPQDDNELAGPQRSMKSYFRNDKAAYQTIFNADATTLSEEQIQALEERQKYELQLLVELLPPEVRSVLEGTPEERLSELIEVVMDLGRPPLARFKTGDDMQLSEKPVEFEDLDYATARVGEFGGDNRAGIDGTLHRISCIRNRKGMVVGLTCRVGRAVPGSATMVADLAMSGASMLMLGRPGVGKTTAIREICRMLSDDCAQRVVIVDTSNEIGGDGDVPHSGIGGARRMQVSEPEKQHRVMIEAVENHMPQVVVIDEIGTEDEALAARTIAERGVQLVATAHGNYLENVVKNPALTELVGGISSVTLGDDEARRRGVQKSVLERSGPPTFDVCVEMIERAMWRVHTDVGTAVDVLLAGNEPRGELRERLQDGQVVVKVDRMESAALIGETALSAACDLSAMNGRGPGAPMGSTSAPTGNPIQTSPSPSSSSSSTKGLPRPGPPAGLGSLASALESSSSGRSKGSSGASAGQGTLWSAWEAGSPRTGGRGMLSSKPMGQSKSSGATNPLFQTANVPSSSGSGAMDPLISLEDEDATRLFLYAVDEKDIVNALSALNALRKVKFVQYLDQADVVLSVRSKLKGNAELRAAAKAAAVPVYAIKGTSPSQLIKAMRVLLGLEPTAAPVGLASKSMDEEAGQGPSPMAEAGVAPTADAVQAAARSEAIAMLQERGATMAGAEGVNALEEARLAIEQLVLPNRQAIELYPRAAEVVALQAELARAYGLVHELIGSEPNLRLRILPEELERISAMSQDRGPASADYESW